MNNNYNNHNRNNNNQTNQNNRNNINRNQNATPTRVPSRNSGNSKNYAKYLSRRSNARKQKRKRTSNLVRFGFRFLVFLIFFVTVSAVFLSLFFFNLTKIKSPQDILYTITTSNIRNSKSQEIPLEYDAGYKNGQYYFPINGIMNKMEFGIAGDEKEFSFFRDKSTEYVKFVIDSNIAYVNGEQYHLSGPCFLDTNNNVYVPLEFLDNHFDNLQISFDEQTKNKITIDILDPAGSCFNIQKAKKADAAIESDAPYFSSDPINFIADLKEYEKYFSLPADTANEYIILINQTHELEQDYIASDLTDLADTRKDGRATQQMRLYPSKALEAFLIEARANGFTNISVTSAYRSYAYQSQLFNNEVEAMLPTYGDKAEEVAAKTVAYPGQSEHQSGLCADMHSQGSALQSYGDTPDGKWLAANAHYFGFILRYPAEKTDITGIKYEPWHFRYVGRYHATRMYEQGLCLEEYWDKYLDK